MSIHLNRINLKGKDVTSKWHLIDADGKIFKKGDFISFEPGSKHSSFTEKGCLILTFMRGQNDQIKDK